MTTAGPNSPGSAANDNSFGASAWNNPTFVFASDDSRAAIGLAAGVSTQYLVITNFGFAIASGEVIDGIEAKVERSGNQAGAIVDARVRIVKGGAIGATDKAAGGTWGNTDADAFYGGASDLWGETWAHSDINASNFGMAIAATNSSGGGVQARVDHVTITVTHHTPGGGGATTKRLAALGVG